MSNHSEVNYIEALSGLRGLAAILVVLSHTSMLTFLGLGQYFGTSGVMIFFTLSGFLMSYLYAQKQPTFKKITSYSISRFSRVAPLYLLVVMVSYLFFRLDSNYPIQIDNSNFIRHLLFSGSENILWSIPPEVQYYVFFILVWLGCFQFFAYKKIYLIIAMLLITCIFLLIREDLPGIFFGFHILFFLLGSVLGLIRSKINVSVNKYLNLFQVLTIALFVTVVQYNSLKLSILEIDSLDKMNMFYGLNSNLLIILLLVFLFSFDTKFSKNFFGNYVMKKIGDSSFSLYLTHVVTIYYLSKIIPESLIGTVFMILISIVVAHVIYLIIERPLVDRTKKLLVKNVLARM